MPRTTLSRVFPAALVVLVLGALAFVGKPVAGEPHAAGENGVTEPRAVEKIQPVVEHYRDHPALGAWPVSGEPHATGLSLRNDIEKGRFIQWLKERHGDPETLRRNWSIYANKRKPLIMS